MQNKRDRVMRGFRTGKINVLVATDLASRGIDVHEITHVINYDIPEDPEVYVHRVGRTARMGATGKAFTFVSRGQAQLQTEIEKLINNLMEEYRIPGFVGSPEPSSRMQSWGGGTCGGGWGGGWRAGSGAGGGGAACGAGGAAAGAGWVYADVVYEHCAEQVGSAAGGEVSDATAALRPRSREVRLDHNVSRQAKAASLPPHSIVGTPSGFLPRLLMGSRRAALAPIRFT